MALIRLVLTTSVIMLAPVMQTASRSVSILIGSAFHGTANYWWLRSSTSTATTVFAVRRDGPSVSFPASDSQGVAFGFWTRFCFWRPACCWWLRSPVATQSGMFVYVYNSGAERADNNRNASNANGVAFGLLKGSALNGTANSWWLRSPITTSAANYWVAYSSGASNNSFNAGITIGVAFGF